MTYLDFDFSKNRVGPKSDQSYGECSERGRIRDGGYGNCGMEDGTFVVSE